MHNANVDRSERLAQTLRIIKSQKGLGATTQEIASWTGSVAVATDVSELRQNGYEIDCLFHHTTAEGRKVFLYYFRGKKENA